MPRREDQTQRTAVQASQQEAAQSEVLPVTGVAIHTDSRRGEFLATADVELAGICTIRNVKIKEDDYDLTVVMPRTKMADTREYKDACFFESRSLREQFDQAVREAYTQTLAMQEEQASGEEQTSGEAQTAGEGQVSGEEPDLDDANFQEEEDPEQEEGMGGISM